MTVTRIARPSRLEPELVGFIVRRCYHYAIVPCIIIISNIKDKCNIECKKAIKKSERERKGERERQ